MSEDPVTSTDASADPDLPEQDDGSVGTLELFFDLVFVYAMSQVTSLMLADISWLGFGHGALALAAIWWAWVCFAWLTATSDDAGPLTRTVIFPAMAAMLVAAIALPKAFGQHALTFGVAYLCVRLLHVVLFVRLGRRDAELRAALSRLIPTLLTGPAFVVFAAFADSPYRELLWLLGGLIDFSGPVVSGMHGWKVLPSYFVERHGNIIIIALGESIVQVGVGAHGEATRPLLLTGVALGVLISAGLWWAYFGSIRVHAERRLQRTRGLAQARLARDSYSYLHLPLVGGIVYFALGVNEAIARPDQPLAALTALALCGGVTLFFAGDVAYRWRDHHQLAVDRLVAAAAAAVVIPLALTAPSLAALVALTAVCAVRAGWEIWHPPAMAPTAPAG